MTLKWDRGSKCSSMRLSGLRKRIIYTHGLSTGHLFYGFPIKDAIYFVDCLFRFRITRHVMDSLWIICELLKDSLFFRLNLKLFLHHLIIQKDNLRIAYRGHYPPCEYSLRSLEVG